MSRLLLKCSQKWSEVHSDDYWENLQRLKKLLRNSKDGGETSEMSPETVGRPAETVGTPAETVGRLAKTSPGTEETAVMASSPVLDVSGGVS